MEFQGLFDLLAHLATNNLPLLIIFTVISVIAAGIALYKKFVKIEHERKDNKINRQYKEEMNKIKIERARFRLKQDQDRWEYQKNKMLSRSSKTKRIKRADVQVQENKQSEEKDKKEV